ncbi:MAG: DUF4258 domain-containing protein [Nitrospinae bacterium]|nr:DUF4258 domain-containing protein [Nitrospinota bacterium]
MHLSSIAHYGLFSVTIFYMAWFLTKHIKSRLEKRNIREERIWEVLKDGEAVRGEEGTVIYQKVIDNKLLRVVTFKDRILTVYQTSKIKKYLKRGNGK